MAVVINGSGTVTGLAVGGLPDGTVDAGTLATNSVDSAELVDGAVDDSHIAALASSKLTGALPAISGASLTGLTSSQMPSGNIVQFASDFDGDFINLNTTSWVDTALSISFTPKFSNSIIAVQAIVNMYNAGASTTHGSVQLRLMKNGALLGQEMILYSGYGGTEALVVGPFPVYYAEVQGNTNAYTYKVQVKNDNTTSGASHNQYNGLSSLYLWEIKV